MRLPDLPGDVVQGDGAMGDGLEPSGSSPFAALDDSGVAERSRLSGLLVLALVAVVGGGVLYGMRRVGVSGGLEMLDIEIDYPVDAVSGARAGSDHAALLGELRAVGDFDQVPPRLVQMNPFEWRLETSRVERADGMGAEQLALAQRRREIEAAAMGLTLNGVMGGRSPVAKVSGGLVRVGDTVAEFFTVRAITGRQVTLVADEEEYVLTLGD